MHGADGLTYECPITLKFRGLDGDCPVPGQTLPHKINPNLTWHAGLHLESCGSSGVFQISAVGTGETAGVVVLSASLI